MRYGLSMGRVEFDCVKLSYVGTEELWDGLRRIVFELGLWAIWVGLLLAPGGAASHVCEACDRDCDLRLSDLLLHGEMSDRARRHHGMPRDCASGYVRAGLTYFPVTFPYSIIETEKSGSFSVSRAKKCLIR